MSSKPTASEEHRKKSGKRLTDEEWTAAKRMWQVEGRTLKEISSHFDVSETSLSERFRRNGIKKNEFSDIKKEAIREERIRIAQEGARDLIVDAYELRKLAIKGQTLITKHTVKIIAETGQNDAAFARAYPNLKALDLAGKILRNSRDMSDDLVLQYEENDDADLPELVVRAMTKDDVEKMRREQEEEAAYMADGGLDGDIEVSEEDFEVDGV